MYTKTIDLTDICFTDVDPLDTVGFSFYKAAFVDRLMKDSIYEIPKIQELIDSLEESQDYSEFENLVFVLDNVCAEYHINLKLCV